MTCCKMEAETFSQKEEPMAREGNISGNGVEDSCAQELPTKEKEGPAGSAKDRPSAVDPTESDPKSSGKNVTSCAAPAFGSIRVCRNATYRGRLR
jgi:hypothetical protein